MPETIDPAVLGFTTTTRDDGTSTTVRTPLVTATLTPDGHEHRVELGDTFTDAIASALNIEDLRTEVQRLSAAGRTFDDELYDLRSRAASETCRADDNARDIRALKCHAVWAKSRLCPETPPPEPEPIDGRPAWSTSAEAHEVYRHQLADQCGLKSGELVWDKITGAGPYVVLWPSQARPGSVVVQTGEDRHALLNSATTARGAAFPAVALTTTNPRPPWDPPLWQLILAVVASVVTLAAVSFYVGTLGVL